MTMQRHRVWITRFVLMIATPAFAHGVAHRAPVVVDCDVGLDDVVALAMALQNPEIDIAAIVACEGVAGRQKGVEHLERMLDFFNRRDIPLYAPANAGQPKTPPPFRSFAEGAVERALPRGVSPSHRPFSPDAYAADRDRIIVLVLGPLTNLATALKERPEIGTRIQQVIVSGSPEIGDSWNVRYDPEALAIVRTCRVPLAFVVPGASGRKPEAWREGDRAIGQGTSLGEDFLKRLLAESRVRAHYCDRMARFYDELALLYYVDSTLFSSAGTDNVFAPRDSDRTNELLSHFISAGRQHKARVVLAEHPLPDTVFQEDIRQRKTRLIGNNGEDEWFAQLLTNELHQHLGAYSVIGVKMGFRAAELLNAPQHSMKIASHTAPRPPVSCMNDGVIVATGSTPGRGLFKHVAGSADSTSVVFSYNDRDITLALKEEYRERINERIRALNEEHPPESPECWEGIRQLGLDIWENWHRRDLFETVDSAEDAGESPTERP